MNKQQFIAELREKLSGIPEREVEERLSFYAEMIDDRMEEGLAEEEAVAQIGGTEEIAARIVADIPLVTLAKKRIQPQRRLRAWEIVLLCVGAPVWGSLLIAAVAAVLSLYASLWAVIVSLWAGFGALIGGAVGGLCGGLILAIGTKLPTGLALVGAGVALAGIGVFWFFGCKALTRGFVRLTGQMLRATKQRLVKKEGTV